MFFAMTLVMSQIPIDFWLRWAYPAYAAVLLMLMAVEAIGAVGGGSQRWLDLGPVQLQPSELMKIAIVTALARYFHFLPRVEAQNFRSLVPPALMIEIGRASCRERVGQYV